MPAVSTRILKGDGACLWKAPVTGSVHIRLSPLVGLWALMVVGCRQSGLSVPEKVAAPQTKTKCLQFTGRKITCVSLFGVCEGCVLGS